MGLSIFLAKMIGLFYLIAAVGFLFNKKYYIGMVEKLMKDPGFMFLGGMMAFVAGFAIVTYHNVWQGWPIIITIFGWAGILKAFTFFVFPKFTDAMTKWFMKRFNFVWMPLLIFVALLYSYFGFLY